MLTAATLSWTLPGLLTAADDDGDPLSHPPRAPEPRTSGGKLAQDRCCVLLAEFFQVALGRHADLPGADVRGRPRGAGTGAGTEGANAVEEDRLLSLCTNFKVRSLNTI